MRIDLQLTEEERRQIDDWFGFIPEGDRKRLAQYNNISRFFPALKYYGYVSSLDEVPIDQYGHVDLDALNKNVRAIQISRDVMLKIVQHPNGCYNAGYSFKLQRGYGWGRSQWADMRCNRYDTAAEAAGEAMVEAVRALMAEHMTGRYHIINDIKAYVNNHPDEFMFKNNKDARLFVIKKEEEPVTGEANNYNKQ